jgi:hypothetical protein
MNLALLSACARLNIKEYFHAGPSENEAWKDNYFFRLEENYPHKFFTYNRKTKELDLSYLDRSKAWPPL